jgi:diguanylate cyclase (GGDEF)-like protein
VLPASFSAIGPDSQNLFLEALFWAGFELFADRQAGAGEMLIAPKPTNEAERLEKLASYNILDTGREETFDRITRLAARMFRTPIALISLVGEDRQWFKSAHGFEARESGRDKAFCAHTILRDEVMVVHDAAKDPRFAQNPQVKHQPHIRFYAGAPLVTPDGFNLGSLCVIDRAPRDFSAEDRDSLADLARLVVQSLELRRLASIDPVTELPNRRFFEDVLGRECKRAQRSGRSLAVVMVSLDRLPGIVDEFGVAAGDQVLLSVTDLLRGQLRASDLLVRFGLQEFAVLLPDTDAQGSSLVAEHLRQELEFASFMTEKGDLTVTASIGVAQCDPSAESVEQTVARAIEATKIASGKGGNSVSADNPAGGSELEAR